MNKPLIILMPSFRTVQTITLTTPVPPSLNNAYTNGRNNRRVLSDEGRAFKEYVTLLARQARAREFTPGYRVRFVFTLWFKDRRPRDPDNCVKLLLDALAKALDFNDCYVVDFRVTVAGYDATNPRCEVVLEELAA